MDVKQLFKQHGIDTDATNDSGWDKYTELIRDIQNKHDSAIQYMEWQLQDKEAIISTLSKAIQVMFKQMID